MYLSGKHIIVKSLLNFLQNFNGSMKITINVRSYFSEHDKTKTTYQGRKALDNVWLAEILDRAMGVIISVFFTKNFDKKQ